MADDQFIVPTGLPDDLKDCFNRGFRLEALLIANGRKLDALLEAMKPQQPAESPTTS